MRWWSVVLVALVAGAGCKTKYVEKPTTPLTDTDDPTDTTVHPPDIKFVAHSLGTAPFPAWGTVADLDDDGTPEVIVSSLGEIIGQTVPPGSVIAYSLGSDFDDWDATIVIPESLGIRYPGKPNPYDMDGDGDLDLVLPSGGALCQPSKTPCGAIRWFENVGNLNFVEHVLFDGIPIYYSDVEVADIDGDGKDDIVAAAEVLALGQAQIHLFRGTAVGAFEQLPLVIESEGGGRLIDAEDVDGDGLLDVLSGDTFQVKTNVSFAWYENKAPTGFTKHKVSGEFGAGYQFGMVKNLTGGGGKQAIGTNHTNTEREYYPDDVDSEVILFDIPADPTGSWSPTIISEGIVPETGLSPGSWDIADADGDGDDDVVVAGEGDPNVYLLDNDGGDFTTRVLASGIGQSAIGGTRDFDDDGDTEIVVIGAPDRIFVVEKVVNE